AVALILSSFVLFALDAKFVTHGVLSIGGIVIMVLGALLLVDAPIPEMRVHLGTALAVSIPLGRITAFLIALALKHRRHQVVSGEDGLVGETGGARSVLMVAGKVFVHGESWDAIASAEVGEGERIVVRRVDGLLLHVDPASVETTIREPPDNFRVAQ